MNRFSAMLLGLGIGAGAMYFFDPRYGNRRRAMVTDQWNGLMNRTDNAIDTGVRDLRNRTRGILADAMAGISDEPSSDWVIHERVRAEMGRMVPNAGAIKVDVNQGQVSLTGPVLQRDVDRLISRISIVRGVKGVTNNLMTYQEPGEMPNLQGTEQEMPSAQMQGNWTPTARLLASVGGAGMLLFGVIRGGILGLSMSAAGVGLATRGISNTNIGALLGISPEGEAVHVRKGITINSPIDQVYNLWSNFENFPKFMSHLESVKDLGNGRSHWVAKGPGGVKAEWDAVMTENIPERVISWRSTPDSDVKTRGTVRFQPAGDGETAVNVQMSYTPPAGVIGHAVAKLFGDDPKSAMDDDMVRMKSLLETGKTTAKGREVTDKEV